MDLKLKNKTVFISGSSKGIGFETAKLFLEEFGNLCRKKVLQLL